MFKLFDGIYYAPDGAAGGDADPSAGNTTPPNGGTGDPATGTTVPQPGLTTQQYEAAVKEANDWKARAGGFQSAMQKAQELSKVAKEQLDALTPQIQSITTERDAFKEQVVAKDLELGTVKNSAERLGIVLREFPTLIGFLGESPEKDLLPQGTGDELREKLKSFAERLGTVQPPKTGGAVPTLNSKGTDKTPESKTLFDQAMAASRKGDIAESDRLMDEYFKSK